jgi:hypothetical protein
LYSDKYKGQNDKTLPDGLSSKTGFQCPIYGNTPTPKRLYKIRIRFQNRIFSRKMGTIEILIAMLEEACLKKGEFFSADIYPIL